MGFFGFLVFVAVWTAICVALVAGLERLLELFGYRATPVDEQLGEHVPPLPEE